MERILGIRVKLQVIPPPGERDPNSITKIDNIANTMSSIAPRCNMSNINSDKP
jgi:hypothetical protein